MVIGIIKAFHGLGILGNAGSEVVIKRRPVAMNHTLAIDFVLE